jgi:hypothetical protein
MKKVTIHGIRFDLSQMTPTAREKFLKSIQP